MKTEKLLKVETWAYFIAILLLYWNQYSAWNGQYLDSDNYFHVLRIIEFFKHPSYWEQVFPYTNSPFGEVLHWTRALDLFLAAVTLPFLYAYPLKTAAFYGGLFVAPFFALVAGYAFLKGTRCFLQWKYRVLAALLILVQANVLRVVAFNRPDHHAAFFCLTALMLWGMVKFIYTKKREYLFSVAVIAAFALWMAVEGVFLAVAAGGFLLYGYLFLEEDYQNILRFVFIYSLAITLFWLINPPYEGFLYIDTGRLSAFYICVAWGGTAILLAAQRITDKQGRIAGAVAGFMLMIGIMFAAGWLTSPLDERVIPLFVDRISEMSAGNIYTLAYPFFGCVAGLMLFKKLKNNEVYIYLLISLLLFSGLTVFSMRFLMYAGVLAAIVLALFVQEYLGSTKAKVWTVMGFVLLEYVSFVAHVLLAEIKMPPVLVIPLDVVKTLPKGTVATDLFFAPDIIWNSEHKVIASPYHRNVEGIIDNHEIFHNPDMNEVRRLLCRHNVNYILLPDGLAEESYYSEPAQNTDKLYGMILSGQNIPEWLTRIPTPAGYLYRVDDVSHTCNNGGGARRTANGEGTCS